MNWYLLMSRPREEGRAKQHLENQGFRVFHPLIKTLKLTKGKQQTTTESLFPRYLFIQLDELLNDWSTIRSTRGVADLVRFAGEPARMPQTVIDDLLSQVDGNDVIDQAQEMSSILQKGDVVEVVDGSFKGWQAVVKEQDSDTRVILLLKMLGKDQALDIPLAAVKKL